MSEQKTTLDNAPIDNAPIIKRIEVLLAVKEATKADFYKQTSVSSATYAQWNANQYKPSRKKLQAIAEYFGVTVDYILTGEQKEKAPQSDVDRLMEGLNAENIRKLREYAELLLLGQEKEKE